MDSAANYDMDAIKSFHRQHLDAVAIADAYFYLGNSLSQFDCATGLLEPYLGSKNKSIREAAGKARLAIADVSTRTRMLHEKISQLIESPSLSDTFAKEFADEISSFAKERSREYDRFRGALQFRIISADFSGYSPDIKSVKHLLEELQTAFGNEVANPESYSPSRELRGAREVAGALYRYFLIPSDRSCEAVASRLFLENFHTAAPEHFAASLRTATDRYGDPAKTLIESVILRTVADVGFLNAWVHSLDCTPQSYLVVMGRRLLFFAWRTSNLLSRRESASLWPPEDVVADYAATVETYAGSRDLEDAGLLGFQAVLAKSSVMAAYQSMVEADLAELFVVLHEIAHIPDMQAKIQNRYLVTMPAGVQSNLKNAWKEELQADADALVWLWQTAKDRTTKIAACAASDTAVSVLGLGVGKMKLDSGASDLVTMNEGTHPPTEFRRASLKRVCLKLSRESGMTASETTQMSEQLDSRADALELLLAALRKSRPELLKEIGR